MVCDIFAKGKGHTYNWVTKHVTFLRYSVTRFCAVTK